MSADARAQAEQPAAPAPRGAIDILMYPHLLETIIAAATYPVLLTLRGTCTALRDAVDAALFAHVGAEVRPIRGKSAPPHMVVTNLRITRDGGRCVLPILYPTPAELELLYNEAGGRNRNTSRWIPRFSLPPFLNPATARRAERDRVAAASRRRQLAHVRTMDQWPSMTNIYSSAHLAAFLPRQAGLEYRVFRRIFGGRQLAPLPSPARPTTIIDFILKSPKGTLEVPLCTRHVLNFAGIRPEGLYACALAYAGVREIAVVLASVENHDPPEATEWALSDDDVPMYVPGLVLYTLRDAVCGGASVEFVGLEAVGTWPRGRPCDAQLHAAWRRRLVQIWTRGWENKTIPWAQAERAAREQVRFTTGAAWLASAPDEEKIWPLSLPQF